MKEKIDVLLSKWLSRKLMVFFVATALTLIGKVQSDDWVDIAIVYIGSEAAIDAVTRLRGFVNNRKQNTDL